MKRIVYLFLMVCLSLPLMAESEVRRADQPHQLRIGWGDQHFEHLVWHASPKPMNVLPDTYTAVYAENFRYTQHWFVEYQYRFNRWFSLGGMIDGSGVLWDNVTRTGSGVEQNRDVNHSLYNIIIMPTVYFTYFHHEYVSLHSGLGVGMDINGGTETDYKGRKTVCAPAVNLTLFGVRANYKSWFAGVDLGAMIAMNGGQNIYQFGSRLISISTGVTF